MMSQQMADEIDAALLSRKQLQGSITDTDDVGMNKKD